MKLIDLLVQELPKCGGWPEGYNVISTNGYGQAWCYSINASGETSGKELYIRSSEEGHVTREQYEAALAAAQQPVWNGEGLPPVGCRIEAFSGGEWVEAIVTYNEPPEFHGDAAAWKEVLAFDCKTTRPFWTDEFRPIRSEADKRRDEAIAALKKLKPQLVGELAGYLYDEIAAGKIPHIRIE
ncbi:hypothetical protein [Cronobacter sakazakii]|uniref:hypothetical protein n=1 Tax=Cronobacter sakazakii TaxID=28141 RepID=UPI0011E479E6|nr:hypothetical protein [Cronobacter sakazakii]TYD48393.1 hypothetical protein FNN14_20760 [Cronobacter sakazakii]